MGEVKDRVWELMLSYALAVVSCYGAVWAVFVRDDAIAFGCGLSAAIAFLLVHVLSCRLPLQLTVDERTLPGRPLARRSAPASRRH